ncbi:kinesin-like protein KIF20B isoform X2 [Pseudophryne corroboree]|uniref:kinesin-like protein KIF20B isoform X2 n=1 Tax=Pseudophryne corroboree TaxID=495146 RepID=UPI0030817081
MKPSEDHRAHPRPSYLGEDINYPERDGPQEIDDIRTNLFEKFSLLGECEADTTQKSSLDTKEHMHVYLRVRPFTASEVEHNESQDCVSIPDSCSVLVKAPLNSQACRLSDKSSGSVAQKFTFTHVFGPETTQSQFFGGTLKKQVIDFMTGQNRLIFTYGVTNAGKTFTFQGTKDDAGILPRSMEMLFNTIEGKVYNKMDIKPHRCRDYVRLTKEQVKTEAAFKNGVLRHTKEVDSQCSIRSNNSRTSADTTDFLSDEVGGPSNSSRVHSEYEDTLGEEFKLDVDGSIKFSVWVSFCEIYNECIYDLLDPISGDKFYKRKTLKLAQDIKGFSFVKDLQWIQVSDAREACRILALGKKFQSIAFTKLNSSSSRSHSIFTVRLLKIEDADVPRVVKVSELALCDLAGSERCTKTHHEGERLKESGNINTSLLILGKCINALKNSQHLKAQQHVPFRESKLTHYLQSFFSGKGKVSMIVNICQSASAYDETLNVLKFSAVAQKVLILDSCQASENLSYAQRKSAREVSFIINNADNKMWVSRKRATVQWDSRLEDVLEDGDEQYEDNSDDEECLDCTNIEEQDDDNDEEVLIKKEAYEKLLELVEDLKIKLVNEKKDKLLMELKIREEVANEFTQHFMQRENDFSERLQKEKELMEERCDERIEIFQDLVRKCSSETNEEKEVDKEFCSVTEPADQNNLGVIKKQALEAYNHIAAIQDDPKAITDLQEKLKQAAADLHKSQEELKRKSADLETQIEQCSRISLQLEEADQKLSSQRQQIDQIMDMIQQKDTAIEKLKDLVSHWEAKCEDCEKTGNRIEGERIKDGSNADSITRKRPTDALHDSEDQPPSKKKELREINNTNMESDQMQNNALKNTLRELKDTKVEKEKNEAQVVNLTQTVAELEEKLARCQEQVIHLESGKENVVTELQTQKDLTLRLEGTVEMLKQEIDQHQLNIASKVDKIKTIQSKLDDFGKSEPKEYPGEVDFFNLNNMMADSSTRHFDGNESQPEKMVSGRESAFYNAVEGLWRKCQEVLQESVKKNKLIQHLEKQLDDLQNQLSLLRNTKDVQQNQVSSQCCLLKEKDELIVQLREQVLDLSNHLEKHKKQEIDYKSELLLNSQQIKDLGLLADSYKDQSEKLNGLEEKSKEKSVAIERLEKHLAELQTEHMDCEKNIKTLNNEKAELEEKIRNMQEAFAAAVCAKTESEKQVRESTEAMELLKKELLQQTGQLNLVQLELQRKEEDYTEFKDKLTDAKKQIQQVEKEISTMREEKKTLTNKMNDYEKLKKQMSCELEMKQRTIQQLSKEHRDNEKIEDTMQLYQKACHDVKTKEKIIEDMKMTLIEQEQTQEEQERALEAKVEEAAALSEKLEMWKQRYRELDNVSGKETLTKLSCGINENTEAGNAEMTKLQNRLNEFEEKYSNDRKNWLEEKKSLIAQAKESESQRNREMRKFAEDRERYSRQQAEMEQLSTQLSEKNSTLQKWREERDSLLSALEQQLKGLLTSNAEKDRKIENMEKAINANTGGESSAMEEMKRQLAAREALVKELQDKLVEIEEKVVKPQAAITDEPEAVNLLSNVSREAKSSTSSDVSVGDSQSQDGSDTVLDSSMISTANGKASRFPKPQMEIRFSPVKPNRMEVKHHGDDSPITVKISRMTRKRKSNEMEQNKILSSCWKMTCKETDMSANFFQDTVRNENRKNTRTNKMTPSPLPRPSINSYESKKLTLKKQPSTTSTASSRKKEGTLQKLGEFLQSSPSIFQTKAKKILETIGAPKTSDVKAGKKDDENKSKKRRKLYTTEISAPLDIPAHAIIMDTYEKESDHLIMKRRLRSRTAK